MSVHVVIVAYLCGLAAIVTSFLLATRRIRARVRELEGKLAKSKRVAYESTEQWRLWIREARNWESRARLAEAAFMQPPFPQAVDQDALRELVQAGRKALALKYHPDRGGSLAAMQNINAVADAILSRSGR